MHTTKTLAQVFNTAQETIRGWSVEFAHYLSPTATPAHGRHRRFTDDDLRVLALVDEMKRAGLLYEDIHAALAAGQRSDPPQALMLADGEQPPAYLDIVRGERDDLQRQLAETQAQAARLQGQLERVEQQLTHTEQALKADLAAAQAEIIRLHRENAKLEMRLEQTNDV